MRNKKINISSSERNNSKNILQSRQKLPLKDNNNINQNLSNQKNINNNEIKKDVNKNQSSNKPNFWDKTKNFFKEIWANKFKRYIAIGIVSTVVVVIIVVSVAVSLSKSDSDSEPFIYYECSDPEYETPDCSGACSNPYNIEVYSECALRKKLINECRYKNGSALADFVIEAIKRHNVLRACHNAEPLMFNCEILKISQDYANKNPSGHSQTTFHGKWMGENLYWSTGMTLTGNNPVDRWYNEISDYNFEEGKSNGGVTGHFTQVVWKSSRELGIGYYCKGTSCCVVGNYYPGGNYNNLYKIEVQAMQN